ncbi:nitrite/sulfite reductase [Rhodovulum sp. DZ06]|uniref:nitrite/sulfite reductase n=1 Tax=Rhodovulum sp. DZ06 TaxID=3425126 RepID=UPI003D337FCF
MYRYDEFDHAVVAARVDQFEDQIARRISGALTEDEFKPLRLMNGLYLQLHAYMLRVAIPYGTLNAVQMRQLAQIAETYDKGYGHWTTRQNIQFNWPKLTDIPAILRDLAAVEMHAIQTSGNCIRNVTSDPFAGVAADEYIDPRPVGELIRQWSTDHPEFTYLGRKFKIAITGATADRAAVYYHDIGLMAAPGPEGEIGWKVIVGGGQGRTPMIGKVIKEWVSSAALLGWLEAILRVYNLHGRRDNKYKARIKILVHEMGLEAFKEEVEAEYARTPEASHPVAAEELKRIEAYFAAPDYAQLPERSEAFEAARAADAGFDAWIKRNAMAHRVPGYAAVTVTVKPTGGEPGDMTSEEMRLVADLAERHGFGEMRITHEQNIVLPDVPLSELHAVYVALAEKGLAEANKGLITDIIACPGLDYCALATARSIPIAQDLSTRFADPKRQQEIGPMAIKISGCINACGHHHVGHVGILGLDKAGEEFYQITLGGDATETPSLGQRSGPGFSAEEVGPAIERLVDRYLSVRETADETFLQTCRRLGPDAFKEALHDVAA